MNNQIEILKKTAMYVGVITLMTIGIGVIVAVLSFMATAVGYPAYYGNPAFLLLLILFGSYGIARAEVNIQKSNDMLEAKIKKD